MAAPAVEYQGHVFQAIRADAEIAVFVADRIYDRMPEKGDQSPFITIGEGREIHEDWDCKAISQHDLTVNVWSEKQGGFKEAKEIAFLVKRAVLSAGTDLPTHAMTDLQALDVRYMRDPDGLTSRALLTFQADIEEL